MKRCLLQPLLALVLASCGRPLPADATSGAPPFAMAEVGRFDSPWAMAFLPDGTALVTEKGGSLKHWRPDGKSSTISGVPAVATGGQAGLFHLAIAPDFSASGRVYFTFAQESRVGGTQLALARGTLKGARLEDVAVIWNDPEGGNGGHFGAIIAFARDGNSLFLATGERQRFTPAQNLSHPLGKILHLNLDGKAMPGNPFVDQKGSTTTQVADPPKNSELAKTATGRTFRWAGANSTPAQVWSYGHRNPYGLAFAPDGRLWEAEMGPKGGDELNLIEKGKNYGYPLVSDGTNYDGVPFADPKSRPDLVPAKLFWVPSLSPTTLVFYTGSLFKNWQGSALLGSLSGQSLVRVKIDGDVAQKADRWDLGMRIRYVAQGPDGAVYLLEDGNGGRLLKLTPAK